MQEGGSHQAFAQLPGSQYVLRQSLAGRRGWPPTYLTDASCFTHGRLGRSFFYHLERAEESRRKEFKVCGCGKASTTTYFSSQSCPFALTWHI